MADNESSIDQTQWLPRGESIITPERESKDDLRVERDEDGNIRYVQRQLSTVMNELERRGTLESQHTHDGQTYEVWQTIFRSRLGFRNNPIYDDMAGMRRMVSEDDLQVDDFCKLIQKLGADTCGLIESALYEHVTPRTMLLIDQRSLRYRMAFNRLSEVMEHLRNEWRKRQEAEQDSH